MKCNTAASDTKFIRFSELNILNMIRTRCILAA